MRTTSGEFTLLPFAKFDPERNQVFVPAAINNTVNALLTTNIDKSVLRCGRSTEDDDLASIIFSLSFGFG